MPKISSETWDIIAIDDIELRFYYTYTPGQDATRDPGGNLIDPPTSATVEISGIYLESKEADLFDLFQYSTDDLEEKLLEFISEKES